MKKIFFSLAAVLFAATSFAQGIVLERSFPNEDVMINNFIDHEDDMLFSSVDRTTGMVKVYDDNYSLIASFTPSLASGYELSSAYYPSKVIYSSDGNYYILINSTNTSALTSGNQNLFSKLALYDMSGNMVYDFGTAYQITTYSIFEVNGDIKMLVKKCDYSTTTTWSSYIYKLGGAHTALNTPSAPRHNRKYIQNAQVLVEENDRTYNMTGARVK